MKWSPFRQGCPCFRADVTGLEIAQLISLIWRSVEEGSVTRVSSRGVRDERHAATRGRAATGYGPDSPPSRHSPPSRQQPGRQQPERDRASRPAVGARAGRDRLYEIDLLRITAALAVVFYHYTFSGYAGHLTSIAFPALSTVTRYGYLGVDMFFTISGFVVLLSAWGRRPHEFVISRIVRLYPAYWVAVTITAIVAITLSHGLFKVTPTQYVANLTMINSLPHIANVDVVYWTLWTEIRFYVLVFVLAWIGITRTRVVTVLWLWLAAAAGVEGGVPPGRGA